MTNLADHLFTQARTRGDKIALIFERQEFTFAGLADRVRAVAAGLASCGVTAHARVGLMMASSADFIIYQQAIFALGATFSPLNIFYRTNELVHAIASCRLEYLVVGPEFLDRLPKRGATGTASLKGIVSPSDRTEVNGHEIMRANRLNSPVPSIAGPIDIPETSIGMLLHTSATTGKSKGVMLTLANIAANYDRTPGWLGLTAETVTLCALPLYNTFGLNQCINALMVTGGSMVLLPRFEARACIDAIEKHRCTFLPAVPTMLQKIFDDPSAAHHDLTSISRILTGGAPVPAPLIERVHTMTGPDTVVMTGYGLTEATALVSIDHVTLSPDGLAQHPKSIGKVLDSQRMCILKDDGQQAATGEIGEICLRGPNIMAGYFDLPEETAIVLAGGWLHTGDIGYLDAEGRGHIVDRKKDIIIRGGQNIYPADIEEVLYRIDGVSEAAVVAQPDDVLGEIVVAYVAAKPGSTLSTDDMLARCKEELAHFKVPAAIHILPELPKGPTGKILRRELKGK